MYVMRKLKLTEIEELRTNYGFAGGKVWFFSSLSPSVTSVLHGYRIIWQSLKSGKAPIHTAQRPRKASTSGGELY